MLLTEARDDVVRLGHTLRGIWLGGESGPADVGPGTPFLHGPWKFEE